MIKLIDDKGKVVFESSYESSSDVLQLDDNTRYGLYISSCRYCNNDLTLELYIDDILCKSICILKDKNACLPFSTSVGSKVYFRIWKGCVECQ